MSLHHNVCVHSFLVLELAVASGTCKGTRTSIFICNLLQPMIQQVCMHVGACKSRHTHRELQISRFILKFTTAKSAMALRIGSSWLCSNCRAILRCSSMVAGHPFANQLQIQCMGQTYHQTHVMTSRNGHKADSRLSPTY